MTTKHDTHAEKVETPSTSVSYYEAVGRRREATSRVRLYVADTCILKGTSYEKGAIVVNGKSYEHVFTDDVVRKMLMEPFRTTNTVGRFIVSITSSGGGMMGQVGAMILGISRALEKVDKEKFRPILKKRGFLSRDSRIKQRRKAGFAGKARARKQSPKR